MVDVTPKVEALVERLITAMHYRENTSGFREDRDHTEAPALEKDTPMGKEVGPQQPQVTEEAVHVPTSITDEEMRQHMDMCISKFAGNGWGESKDPRTVAIRKGCTKAFKEIAKWLGAEKPTSLEPEKRQEFVNRLKEIFIEEEEGKAPVIEFRPF